MLLPPKNQKLLQVNYYQITYKYTLTPQESHMNRDSSLRDAE